MSTLAFGIWDAFGAYEVANFPRQADIYEQHIREVQLAEELGYRYYFIIEHQNSPVGQITAPSVYLTAVARATTRIRMGVMIYQLPFHNPMRLAQEAAMLDHLSHGRLEFGAGLGTLEHEFMRWKIPYDERREMSTEALEIILKAWTEETVTHAGKYWQFDEALPVPKPYQKPHPPVWFAAHSPTSLEYAARHNFHVSQNLDVDEVIAEKFALYRSIWRECGHAGPMPRMFLMRAVHVAETDDIARAEAEPSILRSDRLGIEPLTRTRLGFKGNPDTVVRSARARGTREQRASYDWWVDSGVAVVGSPQTVRLKLAEQQARCGYDVFCANHRFGGMPLEQSLKSLKLFGEEVIPAFA
jgi:alkanesulfonate monooxygenase SsuD/methylene tetrahydromethanopterin reductase-like flavin-dependent oxidoreductase (luciferase family)